MRPWTRATYHTGGFGRWRRGLSLPEVVVAVTIVVVLAGLLLVAGRSMRGAARQSRAQAQLQLLAGAMSRYAEAWPAWPESERGWPHWNGWVLFPAPPYDTVAGYNDSASRQRDVSDDDDPNDADRWDDVRASNETLTYALTVSATGTAIVHEREADFAMSPSGARYPKLPAETEVRLRRGLTDAWGTPYRYLWVARDAQAQSGWRAITSADSADFADPSTNPADPFFIRAEGFVIESAGPDGRFGNIWKRAATGQELRDAEDNVSIQP